MTIRQFDHILETTRSKMVWFTRWGWIPVAGLIGYATGVITIKDLELARAVMLTCFLLSAIWVCSRALHVPQLWPFLAFSFPFALALINTKWHFLPAFPDATYYDQLGWSIAQTWRAGSLPNPTANLQTQAYAYMEGCIYFLLGHSPLAMSTLNAGFWGLAVVFWLSIARKLLKPFAAPFSGLLLAVYPAATLYSAVNLRESIVLLLIAIACWSLIQWLLYNKWEQFFRALITSGIATLFRPEMFPAFWSAGIVAISLGRKTQKLKQLITVLMIILILLGSTVFLNLQLPDYINPFQLGLIEAKRAAEAAKPHAYLPNNQYYSWGDVMTSIPIRLIYLLLSPFPWEPSHYRWFVLTVDSFYILSLLWLSLLGIVRLVQRYRSEGLFLLTFAMVILIGYALSVSTIGVASRRRMYALPILIILTGDTLATLRRHFADIKMPWLTNSA